MRLSVAVVCALFALQVSQVQASLGPVHHDGFKVPAGVSAPKSLGFSEIYGNTSGTERGPDRRSTLDLIPWARCVIASKPDIQATDPYYTSCGELYDETDSFCELSRDADYCTLDSRYCSGGIYAAYNLVVFNAGNYCYASEEACCEITPAPSREWLSYVLLGLP